MKDLTTFLFGLIMGALGFICFCLAAHYGFSSFWTYFYGIAGIVLFFTAYNKIEKSIN